MVVKLVGVETENYNFKDGSSYQGKKLHVLVVDEHKPNLTGCPVMVLKIPSSSEFFPVPVEVDKLYNIFFDHKGKLAYLVANNK